MQLVNADQFTKELLSGAQGHINDDLVKFQIDLTLKVLNDILTLTPVDFGHLFFNWQITVGQPFNGIIGAPDQIAAPNDHGLFRLADLGRGNVVYITNNVPYAAIWEYGLFVPPDPGPSKNPRKLGQTLVVGGYNVVAPEGMVRVTVAKYDNVTQE